MNERDSYIFRRIGTKLGKPQRALRFDVDYSGGKVPLALAIIMETNKEVFERWKKRPVDLNESIVREISNSIIDKFAFKYRHRICKA